MRFNAIESIIVIDLEEVKNYKHVRSHAEMSNRIEAFGSTKLDAVPIEEELLLSAYTVFKLVVTAQTLLHFLTAQTEEEEFLSNSPIALSY